MPFFNVDDLNVLLLLDVLFLLRVLVFTYPYIFFPTSSLISYCDKFAPPILKEASEEMVDFL